MENCLMQANAGCVILQLRSLKLTPLKTVDNVKYLGVTFSSNSSQSNHADPVRVVITGASGLVSYDLSCLIGHGAVFGKHQPVILILHDVPETKTLLDNLVKELQDSAMHHLEAIIATSDITQAFTNVDVVILLNSIEVKEGVSRYDQLDACVNLFKPFAAALEKFSKQNVKVLCVGSPVTANIYILSKFAPSVPKNNFSGLTRLDHNRAIVKIAKRLSVSWGDVYNVIIWGNRGEHEHVDLTHAKVILDGKQKPVPEALDNEDWMKNDFVPHVQSRSEATTSAPAEGNVAASMVLARAVTDHIHDWWLGTNPGRWTSMTVYSRGEYGAPEDTFFSFPVFIDSVTKEAKIVEGLTFDDWGNDKFEITSRDVVSDKKKILKICSCEQQQSS